MKIRLQWLRSSSTLHNDNLETVKCNLWIQHTNITPIKPTTMIPASSNHISTVVEVLTLWGEGVKTSLGKDTTFFFFFFNPCPGGHHEMRQKRPWNNGEDTNSRDTFRLLFCVILLSCPLKWHVLERPVRLWQDVITYFVELVDTGVARWHWFPFLYLPVYFQVKHCLLYLS